MSTNAPQDSTNVNSNNDILLSQKDRPLCNEGGPERVNKVFTSDPGMEYVGTLPYRLAQYKLDPADYSKEAPPGSGKQQSNIRYLAKMTFNQNLPKAPDAPSLGHHKAKRSH